MNLRSNKQGQVSESLASSFAVGVLTATDWCTHMCELLCTLHELPLAATGGKEDDNHVDLARIVLFAAGHG